MPSEPVARAATWRGWADHMVACGIDEERAFAHFEEWAEEDAYFPLEEELAAMRAGRLPLRLRLARRVDNGRHRPQGRRTIAAGGAPGSPRARRGAPGRRGNPARPARRGRSTTAALG